MVGVLVTTVACTSAPIPPASSPVDPRTDSRRALSPIREPIDLTAYLQRPCAAVPTDLGDRFGFDRSKAAPQWVTVPADGPDPLCELLEAGEQRTMAIRLYEKVRPVPVWMKRYSTMVRTTVLGYPAGTAKLPTKGGPQAPSVCTTYVDVAQTQGVAVAYHAGVGRTPDPCPPSRQAAEAVVAKLAD